MSQNMYNMLRQKGNKSFIEGKSLFMSYNRSFESCVLWDG